jgi:hypothetical protein
MTTETEQETTQFVYPSTAREFQRPTSPLVNGWVASGFHYDKHTGLVQRDAIKADQVSS